MDKYLCEHNWKLDEIREKDQIVWLRCDLCGKLVESEKDDIVYRLAIRAQIRRQIPTRKSVQNGEADRLADLLEEAALEILDLRRWKQSLEDELICAHIWRKDHEHNPRQGLTDAIGWNIDVAQYFRENDGKPGNQDSDF